MIIKNLTPHTITLMKNNELISYASEGIARVSVSSMKVFKLDGVDVLETAYGKVVGLPEQVDGVYYIVSALVRNASNRTDLIVPDGCIRDSNGQVAYCTCWKIK